LLRNLLDGFKVTKIVLIQSHQLIILNLVHRVESNHNTIASVDMLLRGLSFIVAIKRVISNKEISQRFTTYLGIIQLEYIKIDNEVYINLTKICQLYKITIDKTLNLKKLGYEYFGTWDTFMSILYSPLPSKILYQQ